MNRNQLALKESFTGEDVVAVFTEMERKHTPVIEAIREHFMGEFTTQEVRTCFYEQDADICLCLNALHQKQASSIKIECDVKVTFF